MSLSRRSFLGIAGLSLAVTRLHARKPGDSLPTLAVVAAEVRRITALLGGEARTERLGESGAGRPIDLISIGRGPKSILLVGAPHPNEPIGVLTVLRLMERLAQDRKLRQDGGYSFHFIPAIDVDGVALNEGWFAGPRTPQDYLRHFFRPAFAQQPEYAFPLAIPGYRFDAATPENICWQAALEQTRPMLQCSLHGNDANGVFYFLSERRQALAEQLSALPRRYGLAINRIGEAGLGTESYAPGVLSEFTVQAMIIDAINAGKGTAGFWDAGQSSSEYARQLYGTFSLTCEVALWNDPRLYSDRPSAMTIADAAAEFLAQLREDKAVLTSGKQAALRPLASAEVKALDAALDEVRTSIDQRIEGATEEANKPRNRTERLVERDLVQYEPGLSAIRAMAMLARRARLSGDVGVAERAEAIVARRIAAQLAKAPVTPIPYRTSADLQIDAALLAARALERG
jgi:hypothetical protein